MESGGTSDPVQDLESPALEGTSATASSVQGPSTSMWKAALATARTAATLAAHCNPWISYLLHLLLPFWGSTAFGQSNKVMQMSAFLSSTFFFINPKSVFSRCLCAKHWISWPICFYIIHIRPTWNSFTVPLRCVCWIATQICSNKRLYLLQELFKLLYWFLHLLYWNESINIARLFFSSSLRIGMRRDLKRCWKGGKATCPHGLALWGSGRYWDIWQPCSSLKKTKLLQVVVCVLGGGLCNGQIFNTNISLERFLLER